MADETPHRYYSERQGRGPQSQTLYFGSLLRMALSILEPFTKRDSDYLAEEFGYWCPDVDNEWVPGSQPLAFGDLLELETGRDIWPCPNDAFRVGVDDLYDLIEFVHGHISKPVESLHARHDFPVVHYHWEEFDREAARAEFRQRINLILRRADPPVALNQAGEIHLLLDEGFAALTDTELPADSPSDIRGRIASARDTFSRARKDDDVRHAVTDVANALEAIRKDAEKAITKKGSNDFFEILNRFSIRHLDERQIGEATGPELTWLFYVGLATVHYVLNPQFGIEEEPQPTAALDDIDIPF